LIRRTYTASTGITFQGFDISELFFLIKIKPMMMEIVRIRIMPVIIILFDMIKIFSLPFKIS